MHSHSFQDTELKLPRYVNDTPGQIMEAGVDDLYAQRGIVTERFIITYPVDQRNDGYLYLVMYYNSL